MSGVTIDRLAKSWGSFTALNEVSFEVPEHSLTVLLGPSGCGKSTLLRLIAGLDNASGGTIHIAGRDVTHLDAARRGVSMVFQSYALFPHLSVRENILFGLKVRRVPRAEREARLQDAARTVGLTDYLARKPANLSGGQRQRVALARTIVAQQPVCLMDEPLSNLDAKLRAEMRDEIRDLQRQLGLTMIYVTHDQIEAMSMADQIVLLRGGQIEQIGSPHMLYEKPNTAFVARFIGMPPMNVIDLDAQDAEFAAPVREQLGLSGQTIVASIGIRPEHLTLAEQGLALQVRSVDYLGGETVIRARLGESDVFVKHAGRVKPGSGDTLHVSWQPEHVCAFDRHGQAVAMPRPVSPPGA